ncbi:MULTISPECIES: T3SS effector HopA1 family protein [unclassified Kitasatospora]|uniref:T3SS effector HopA1 family protein n=1 Tax=unclassified Kitasatospora TaxID=2633591 RepID=UPI003404F03F
MHGHLELSPRVAALIDRIHVQPGALKAETAGEIYEGETPQALSRSLGTALYQTLHVGRDKPIDSVRRTWRDPAFDEVLTQAVGGRHTRLPVRVLAETASGATVSMDGVRVRVPAETIDNRAEVQSSDGPRTEATVRIPTSRPGLSPGFFLTFSSRGPLKAGGALLRLYARIEDPDAAPEVWRALVDHLEDSGVPWQAKISSSLELYPRNDALVVYLPRPGWRQAQSCAELLQSTGLLGEGTSPFAQPITSSVGCAFEPDDPRPARREMSFGQHRTQVLADALVRHALLPVAEAGPVEEIVAEAFIDAGIDPAVPARNLSSPMTDVLRGY